MASSDLAKLRDALSLALHKMSNEGCESKQFLRDFSSKNQHLVNAASPALREIGLLKVLHDVKGRKTPISSTKGQGELFSEYDGRRFFSIAPDKMTNRKVNIKLADMKCLQLQEWCDDHDIEREKKNKEVDEVKKLLKQIEGHWSEETTVREALFAARKALEAKEA